MPRIMIVEDEAVMTAILTSVLESAGYSVQIALDGLEALEALEAEAFDAVTTDLMMPRMSGRELCERVRSDSRWDGLPILVVTGVSDPTQLAWLADHKDIELLEKPLRPSQLLERIDLRMRSDTPA